MNTNATKTVLFRKFLLSYVFILAIPLLMSYLAYHFAVKVIESNTVRSTLSLLGKTREIADRYFQEIGETTLQVAFSPETNKILNFTDLTSGSAEIYDLWDYTRKLTSRTLTTNMIKCSFAIFLKNSGFTLTPNSTIYDFHRFYHETFPNAKLNYQTWYQLYLEQSHQRRFLPQQTICYNGKKFAAITYLSSLPMLKGVKPLGAIAYYLDEAQIQKILFDLPLHSGGWITLTDQSGTLLAQFPQQRQNATNDISPFQNGVQHRNIQGVKMLLIHSSSAYNGLTYTVALPYQTIMCQVNSIKQLAVGFGILAVISGLFLSCILAYQNSMPFRKIRATLLKFLSNNGQSSLELPHDGYAFFQAGISQLINRTADMQTTISRQASVLKTLLIERLLKGEFDDRGKMETLLSHNGLAFSGKKFIILVIRFNPPDPLINPVILNELEHLRSVLEDTLQNALPTQGYFHLLNENDMALLLSLSGPTAQAEHALITQVIRDTREVIDNQCHISPLFGVGTSYADLFTVHYSLREALQALDQYQHQTTNQTVIWYDQLPSKPFVYFYPTELEIKLIQLTKAGNRAGIEPLLERLRQENLVARSLNKTHQKYLFYEMKSTLIKLASELDAPAHSTLVENSLNFENDATQNFNNIKKIFVTFCQSVDQKRKSHNQLLREQMIRFIDASFTDPSLSIRKLATEFNLSESYVSQFFKEQTGQTFSSYLENLRIEYACKLLLEPRHFIESIAQHTGYGTVNSFRRAFKRVIGVSPSLYKDSTASPGKIPTVVS